MGADIVLSLTACLLRGQVLGLMLEVSHCVSESGNLIKFNISKQLKHIVAKYIILC